MTFSIGLQSVACLLYRAVRADAGEHVLQRAAFRGMVEHVICRHDRHTLPGAKIGEAGNPFPITAMIGIAGRHIDVAWRACREPFQDFGKGRV